MAASMTKIDVNTTSEKNSRERIFYDIFGVSMAMVTDDTTMQHIMKAS